MRFHVMSSQPGCLPDYHTADDWDEHLGMDGDAGMTLDEAQEERDWLVDRELECDERASILYKDERVTLIDYGRYAIQRVIEIVEVN